MNPRAASLVVHRPHVPHTCDYCTLPAVWQVYQAGRRGPNHLFACAEHQEAAKAAAREK